MEQNNSAQETLSPVEKHKNEQVIPEIKKTLDIPTPRISLRKIGRTLFLLSLLLIGIVIVGNYSYRWWQFISTHQETDDAYVTADVHPINARISGTVTEVKVEDNQKVPSKEVLVKLDPNDYQVNLQQAQAALDVAKEQAEVAKKNIKVTSGNAQGQTTQAQGNINAAIASIAQTQGALNEARAGVLVVEAQLAQVKATLSKAKLDYERYNKLLQEGVVAQSQYDNVKATYDETLAQYQALEQQIQQAKARVVQSQDNLTANQARLSSTKGTLQQANATNLQKVVNLQQYKAALAAVTQAEALVKSARLQLSYTTITAPVAGQVGNKTVQVGQRVEPGQTLLSVVSLPPWIIANFKENQLEKMKRGQSVEIKVDAFPSKNFKGFLNYLLLLLFQI